MAESLKEQLKKMKNVLTELRVQVKYLQFDVEATRRERDYYKALMEKK